MPKSTKKPYRSKKKTQNILNVISPDEALAVLKIIAKKDQKYDIEKMEDFINENCPGW